MPITISSKWESDEGIQPEPALGGALTARGLGGWKLRYLKSELVIVILKLFNIEFPAEGLLIIAPESTRQL